MIAQVVPITRLRRATEWWSYRVPAPLSCSAGSLVVVPFRGRPTLGIVWSLQEDDKKATEKISSFITKNPLVRQPHRQFIEWLSQAGVCSLSTALYVWLPKALRTTHLSHGALAKLQEYDKESLSAERLT